jgi:hypothetical protein
MLLYQGGIRVVAYTAAKSGIHATTLTVDGGWLAREQRRAAFRPPLPGEAG